MNEKSLAIVIPAYSAEFLEQTLQSLAKQTCSDFRLYIGDDASPNNLQDIVKQFSEDIEIIYHRFEDNLGRKDLIAHWQRCIELSKEDWIWLFSDDDIMGERCVELFFSYIENNKNSSFLHFDIKIINENNHIIIHPPGFTRCLKINDYFKKRLRYKIRSTVVEYVFTRELYQKENGFVHFDLAWCSDDATWIKFGKEKGITTISGDFVQWRYSGKNISSRIGDPDLILRKLKSTTAYINWVQKFFNTNNIKDTSTKLDKAIWGIAPLLETQTLTLSSKFKLATQLLYDLNYSHLNLQVRCYLILWQLKSKIKDL